MLCIYNTLVCFNNNNKKGWHYKDYAATRILKNSLIFRFTELLRKKYRECPAISRPVSLSLTFHISMVHLS